VLGLKILLLELYRQEDRRRRLQPGYSRHEASSTLQTCCSTPTLVLHARNAEVVPISEGRLLASGIAGAEFVELDSRNHVLLEPAPAWERCREAVHALLEPQARAANGAFSALSTRKRQVLALMAEGLSNARIGGQLHIGEKAVRNHASNLFDKLGVRSRTLAIVFARKHGLRLGE
jgi:ATP/maltotriose-dependent transcriptional regulator MalT